jgi:aspartyl-tRNA(Asn)/glutamyl-tRNA(Gln) amidotransferase subunit C
VAEIHIGPESIRGFPQPQGNCGLRRRLLAKPQRAFYTADLKTTGATMPQKFNESAEKIDVRYVAHLARLHLTDDEAACFQGQLEQVLQYVKELGALNVEGVEPTAHATPVQNVFRKDETRPCLEHEKAMANAPSARGGQFVVPKIIE